MFKRIIIYHFEKTYSIFDFVALTIVIHMYMIGFILIPLLISMIAMLVSFKMQNKFINKPNIKKKQTVIDKPLEPENVVYTDHGTPLKDLEGLKP